MRTILLVSKTVMGGLEAAIALAGVSVAWVGILVASAALFLGFLALVGYWYRDVRRYPALSRIQENPVLRPIPEHWWENEAVFNPAAFVHGGRVHLLYRALGSDGISRIGYASSADGIHFDERLPYPVFDAGPGFTPPKQQRMSYRTLSYQTDTHASGGGWGGTEDPRAVVIDDRVYMSFSLFESWQSLRLAITSLAHIDLNARRFSWTPHVHLSPQGETHKNWVVFPEKINGKFAILHALTPRIMIEYIDNLEDAARSPIQSNNNRTGRSGKWDAFMRGAAAPPLRTEHGWLLLYHGMHPERGHGYNIGAMLLDLADPTRVLYQSDTPILSPEMWYENDWKPGVVYGTGAVLFGENLLVYYGGGDKYVAVAKANLRDLLRTLTRPAHEVDQKQPV